MFNNKRNKMTIPILILTVFITLLTTSCSPVNKGTQVKNQNNDIQKNEIENIETPYDFKLLYSYKNISLNDSQKLMELVSQLQYAKELPIDLIEYGNILRIDYRMNLTEGQEYKVNHTKMMADVIVLLALLDDLYAVEYNLVQGDYSYGGVPITREQAEEIVGKDIWSLGETEEVFLLDLPKIIADLEWDPDVMDVITYEHIMS
ncbi:hypothetical protein JT739_05585 [Tepidanaerobacter sp. GT38]|uniref:hypothetical protein n=1 Tax=Tepidanaerobacter sp. GT38 TaxID=2722793 RepID=UPI001F1F9806|nr:hypothetical protein [Tepidanaerobacter sp. GT38]MCG1012071.1 hypothetical protein [Tepidanaerobacter sp. GT38]